MTAWTLLVVSSGTQEGTIDDQRSWAAEAAAAQGWTITREFAGVSTGKAGPRAIIRELIAELKRTPPDARPKWLLMIRADRVGRGRIAESQIAMHEIVDAGVRIWTRQEGEIKLDSAMDQLVNAVRAATAGFENEVRSEKRRAAVARSRARGVPAAGFRPYGLQFVDGRDIAEPPYSEAVLEAFRLRAEGWGLLRIGDRMRQIAPVQTNADGSDRRRSWTGAGIRAMIRNPAYRAIIDEVTWARAQATAGRTNFPPRRGSVHPWPLAGVIRCYCGGAMQTRTAPTRGGRRRYYYCERRWNHGDRTRSAKADAVEASFVDRLRELVASPELIRNYRPRASRTAATLERELAAATTTLAAVGRRRDAVWRLHEAGNLRDEDVQERLDLLRAEQHAAEAAFTAISGEIALSKSRGASDANLEATIAAAAEAWIEAVPLAQRAVARAIERHFGGVVLAENDTVAFRAVALHGAGWMRKRSGN